MTKNKVTSKVKAKTKAGSLLAYAIPLALTASLLSPTGVSIAEASEAKKTVQAQAQKAVAPIVTINKLGRPTTKQPIYKHQNQKSKVLLNVKPNQTIKILKQQKSWYLISTTDGKIKGWVAAKNFKIGKYVAPKVSTAKPAKPSNIVKPTVPAKPVVEKVEDILVLDNKGNVSIKTMQKVLDTQPQKADRWLNQKVDTKQQFFALLDKVYAELPQGVTIKTTISKDTLYEWETEYVNMTIPSKNTNMGVLASYTLKKTNNTTATLTDKASAKYNAKTVDHALKVFSQEFAKNLPKDLTDEQKLNRVYSYIFDNYTYNASGYQKMMVGNAPNFTMACNGFTKLFHEMATAAGLDVRMVKGDDHYWNQWKTPQGDWVTVDTTTDILLKTKHGATGLSKQDHLNYVSKVGFYWAKPVPQEVNTPTSWTQSQKETFLNAIK